ncbi:MAG: hypothetical protein HETSPECPRED_007804 [Heterodermia speciosa]|uniref:Alpha-1,2-mannosyltransferase n=1 Tax=Heterodermia speciosa TaxID=116794 RepID=A0A8H3FU56_9LECA|nr:MAG: hypothetical protein HETSPECPRED_007804 [Heterodermia speciosa]
MLARLSPRLLLLAIAFFFLLSLLTLNRSGFDPKNIKPTIPNIPSTADLWKDPKHGPSKPSPAIKKFWAKWANIFHESRPQVEPIKVKEAASTANSDNANGERKPHKHNLGLSDKVINGLHDAHKSLLQDRGGLYGSRFSNQSRELFSGTGIVTVAGGPYFAPVIISIRMLRKVTSMPVHVFLESQGEYEPEICEHVLPSLNAECFVVSDFMPKDSPIKPTHYQLKALAILFSTFETIVYIDSDCFPVRDPAEMLTSEPFLSTGLITWPDYWVATEDPVFYTIAGMTSFPPGMPARSTESGELLISKNIHLSSLLLACYYNLFGPTHYYPLLSQGALGEGDKETFLAAAVVLGLPYYRVKEHVATIGYFTAEGDFKGGAMVQHHAVDDASVHNGTYATAADSHKCRPVFLHANFPKMNAGRLLEENKLTTPTGKALRIWGKKTDVEKKFEGRDIEKEVWAEMKDVSCALETVIRDWRGHGGICTRVKEHWSAVFAEGSFLSGII